MMSFLLQLLWVCLVVFVVSLLFDEVTKTRVTIVNTDGTPMCEQIKEDGTHIYYFCERSK